MAFREVPGPQLRNSFTVYFCWFLLRFYLFIHKRHTERGRDISRERSRLLIGSPMRDSILDPGVSSLREGSAGDHLSQVGFRVLLLL